LETSLSRQSTALVLTSKRTTPKRKYTKTKRNTNDFVQDLVNTSSSAMAERPCELGDFERVGHFEAKF